MNADLSTFTEEQEKLDAEIANEQRRIEAEIANQQRQAEAEIANERRRLEGEREQQQNEALREAVSSGNGNVYVVPQGSPLNLSQ